MPTRALRALMALLALCGTAGLGLPAQNQPPPDGPTPTPPAPASARTDPVHAALQLPEYQGIARYMAAVPPRQVGPLARLQMQAAAELPRVQVLLSILRDHKPAQPAAPASSEIDRMTAQLEQLELRLRARRLVEQLGADRYQQRLEARQELARLGRLAVDDLTWGLSSPDPEIADRCLRLLVTIRGRGYIGIGFVITPPALSAEEAARKGLPFVGGVEVDMVQDGLPGAAAGLKSGDILIALGPWRIVTWSDLLRAVDRMGPDTPTTLTLVRDGATQTVQLQLGTRPPQFE